MINTPYEEHTPFISATDSILFFSSQGHQSIGDVDVFYSELGPGGTWQEPISLGYPVNTTGKDVFFNPGWDELDGYYAVRREDDPTSNTINMVIELEPEEVAELAGPVHGVDDQQHVAPPGSEDSTQLPAPAPGEPVPEQVPAEPVRTVASAEPVRTVASAEPVRPEVPVERVIEPEETDEIHMALNRQTEDIPQVAPVPVVKGRTTMRTRIPFGYDSYDLGLEARLELEKVAEIMLASPEILAHLSGRADSTGEAEYNLLLSGQRAGAVSDYLEARGISVERITLEAFGEEVPVARNSLPDGRDAPLGRYLNRQVLVTLTGPEPMQGVLSGLYVPAGLRVDPDVKGAVPDFRIAIQVFADLHPADMDRFRGIEGVEEYRGRDGYYRYAAGRYRQLREALDALDRIREAGYPDAFLRTLEWYRKSEE